jgi:hypothetical protein
LGQRGRPWTILGTVSKTLEEQAGQLKLALEMNQFGISMMRQSLQRLHPDESAAEIEGRLRRWLQETTGQSQGKRA